MHHAIKLVFAVLAIIGLSGCATGQYEAYAKAQAATAEAKHNADAARYKALAAIAENGSDVARVAAVMSLAGFGQTQQQAPALAAPVSPGQTALQWASVLVPGLTQVYAMGQQVKLGIRQSDNATALGLGQSRDQAATHAATFGAITNIAGQIQAPAANVTTTTTLSGTGTLGSGSYSIGPNSGIASGNSGRIAGESIYDLTHTPTVVTQPAPVRPEVVRPEIVRPEIITSSN